MAQTIRTKLLRRVFNADKSHCQFDANLARVCVLFEDLRIEISGAAERSLPALDFLDPQKNNWLQPELTGKYRQFYFIRRSLFDIARVCGGSQTHGRTHGERSQSASHVSGANG
jgi:hypothetical protein